MERSTSWSTFQAFELCGLHRHVGRPRDFGVMPHAGVTHLHLREVRQLFGRPLKRHPGAQADQIFVQAWTQWPRQQLQLFIQGGKTRPARRAPCVVALQVHRAAAMGQDCALVLALALQHLPAVGTPGMRTHLLVLQIGRA